MPTVFVPGKPDAFFPKHKFYGVPVYGNYQRIEECRSHHYVGPAATVEKAVAAYVLTPEHLWATFQTEAEDLIRVNGSMDGHWQERNRRINAAYAKLWLADNRFQWAGLAAFASKQVGCTILHAKQTIVKNRRERENLELSFAAAFPGAEAAAGVQAGTEAGAAYAHDRLGFGNEHLFLDIYPLHRFFMERGWKEFSDYLPKRQNKKYPVYWNVDRSVLPFGTPFQEIRDGFGRVEAGNLADSVNSLARHEQVNILQAIMYNDRVMQQLLDANQYAVVTGIPTGDAEKVELTLSAQCKAKEGFTLPFSRDKHAKLWVAEQRMRFVRRAADEFNKLLNGSQRFRVEESIRTIAAGGGVA
ncbi:hypothetical protein NX774_17775 [Massilia agilis]|uniref:Uncharacterized protein n=1 Tax=Massilia agilis TaxID=1811226 RepID=A0ABT2DEL6_9BURK|nr:hypothetical protein [Massilia agilis]MCS0809775.1 hypothetical protein [Massilia agilis]